MINFFSFSLKNFFLRGKKRSFSGSGSFTRRVKGVAVESYTTKVVPPRGVG
jgi:hypothetical protein